MAAMAATPKTQKLVRDLIPSIILATGKRPQVRQLSDDEYRAALRAKAQEELDELTEAKADEIIGELADLYEVLRAISVHEGIGWAAVEEAANAKRAARGAFAERIWLESVSDP
ncbi:MAG: nucleoside triphosphate pyrophosphohydrolase [Deltaproteobacteria bacterium]|nr:nucleoside triphosphate pyrophosphohydrolase [Deltaproteobacteria bacterium]